MASEPGDRSVLPPQSCMASSVPVLSASGQKVSAAPRREALSASSGALPPNTTVVREEQQRVPDAGVSVLNHHFRDFPSAAIPGDTGDASPARPVPAAADGQGAAAVRHPGQNASAGAAVRLCRAGRQGRPPQQRIRGPAPGSPDLPDLSLSGETDGFCSLIITEFIIWDPGTQVKTM